MSQDKKKEIAFFAAHARDAAYDVFTPEANHKIIDRFVALGGLEAGARVADLGCGSGVYTRLLRARGFDCVGLDITAALLEVGRRETPEIDFVAGDVEALPFAAGRFDGVLLSGMLHHLPDPAPCAAEVARILRPGGRFVAFDPNRLNPFMYLYRDRSSPFYSSKGVTENERPVMPAALAAAFAGAGFEVTSTFVSGLAYSYVASPLARAVLPVYNLLDDTLFRPPFLRRFSSFVFTSGVKS